MSVGSRRSQQLQPTVTVLLACLLVVVVMREPHSTLLNSVCGGHGIMAQFGQV